jgi:transcription elongation factor Elf1
MSFIEKTYIKEISSQLDKFSQKNDDTYNFRCFYCGDSKKSQSKVRGYLYSIGNSFNYRCHNCGKSISFKTFLKDIDPILYEKYILEKFKNTKEPELKLKPVKVIKATNVILDITPTPSSIKLEVTQLLPIRQHFNLPLISDLNTEHPARAYLEQRKIPKDKFDTLYFSENFKQWTNTQKQTFSSFKYDEPRIIIPLICDGNIFGFQGRSISKKSKLKYITIILNDVCPKIYGLNTIDWNKNVYVLEGPFDSMFIPNSIAMAGADVDISRLTNKKDIDFIFIYDNEKRKKEIVDRMEKAINQGHSIVIWPDNLKENDINDMILQDIQVNDIIKNNTFRGLQAKIKFNGWKRV